MAFYIFEAADIVEAINVTILYAELQKPHYVMIFSMLI